MKDVKADTHLVTARQMLLDTKCPTLAAETDFILGLCGHVPAGFHFPERRPLERVEHMIAFLRLARPDNAVTVTFPTSSQPKSTAIYQVDRRSFRHEDEFPTVAIALAVLNAELMDFDVWFKKENLQFDDSVLPEILERWPTTRSPKASYEEGYKIGLSWPAERMYVPGGPYIYRVDVYKPNSLLRTYAEHTKSVHAAWMRGWHNGFNDQHMNCIMPSWYRKPT